MSLSFDNLPLVEATVRFSLKEDYRLPLTAEFIRDLLTELNGLYEVVNFAEEELPPGMPAKLMFLSPNTVSGVHLITNSGNTAMLVYPSLIGARWRGVGSKDYVGYETLTNLVLKVRDGIRNLMGEAPPIAVVNMYYVNEIACKDRSEIGNWLLPNVVPGILEFRDLLKQEAIWKDPSGDIRVSLEYQERPENGPSFVLTTSSGRVLGPRTEGVSPKEADEALGQVHELLGVKFVQIITDHAKQVWEMRP